MGELAALGPFFAAHTHDGDDVPTAPWQTVRGLLDPRVLDSRVARVRTALARGESPESVERRVAASVNQLGLVARLIAPMIAITALTSGRAAVVPDECWWQDQLGGPFPLSMMLREHEHPIDPIYGVIEALTMTTIGTYGVPARTAWGNIASAANSAAHMIERSRPDSGQRARAAADRILTDPRVEAGILRSGPNFRRSSCCLIYQLINDTSSTCGDCILHSSPRHRP